ncbi:MAG: 2-oxo acid dehydrogenase subunit E2 [Bacteroidetes bacterium]|nr:2-oxo acid dehydrogenase subunit E2 [Bacteroidota bacterium]
MAIVDLVMPKLGESIMEATILKWLKQPGEAVLMDEALLEIATDKVDSEVPSTAAGILEEQLFPVNAVVPIGTVIARIRTEAAETISTNLPPSNGSTHEPAIIEETPITEHMPVIDVVPHSIAENGNRFYSPLVLNIAASEGVSMSDLEKIPGTGNEGRVTKKDILLFVQNRKPANGQAVTEAKPIIEKTTQATQPVTANTEPATSRPAVKESDGIPLSNTGNVEIIEMDRMRRLIADHMVRSKQTSPHVTSFSEADVTNIVQWREKMKDKFLKQDGTKITFMPIFLEAVARCIKKYPMVNSSVDGDKILLKKDINIGMATALPSGNLIVPVIKTADQLNLLGLAKQVNYLADAARQNKLKPEDTQNGTFTLTNVGTFGSLMGTPIINQPQVAILAVGAIKKRPVVIETEQGDSIAIRHMMYLSLSYDHRVVDGSIGASFVTAVANELENFDPNREY